MKEVKDDGCHGYPVCMIVKGVLLKMHKDIILAQRWDLSPITRKVLFICLN